VPEVTSARRGRTGDDWNSRTEDTLETDCGGRAGELVRCGGRDLGSQLSKDDVKPCEC